MNFILKPSLKHIVLVKIATTLWNQNDIRALIEKFCIPFFSIELNDKWPKIEDRVKEKAIRLPLPKLLKDETLGLIKPIGLKILKWIKHYGDTFSIVYLPHEFHWTAQGTIDERETAKMLIKNDNIHVTTCYKISCVYCLEDDILKLWHKVPEDNKKTLYSETDPSDVNAQELVVLWTYDIKGELVKMNSMIERRMNHRCSPYQYAFECAAKNGNGAAVEYFLKKLSSSERKESLVKVAKSVARDTRNFLNHRNIFVCEYYTDVLCLLLCRMDEEEQIELFEHSTFLVLLCLINFPWQNFFRETTSIMQKYLSMNDYVFLLDGIIKKVLNGFTDFDYQKAFTESLQQNFNSHKEHIFNITPPPVFLRDHLLRNLFKIRDENNLKLIFQNPTFSLTAKKKIFYSTNGQYICANLIEGEEWGLLKFFIEECMSSKDEVIRFKRDFEKDITCTQNVKIRLRDKWDKFYTMLDDLIN